MADKADKAAKTAEPEPDKGFFGGKTDPTPNEHYTVDGVTAGKPTPETDHKAHTAAHGSPAAAAKFPKQTK